MIGPRVGIAGGTVAGGRIGTGRDPLLIGRYPTTASQLAAAVGWGAWTAAWACDEASGNLAPLFGSPTLTASGTPQYGLAGPLGANDKAVCSNVASTNFSGGNVHDVAANSDLALLVVGKLPAVAQVDIVGKYLAPGYTTYVEPPNIRFLLNDGTHLAIVDASATAGDWFVMIPTLDRSTSKAALGIRLFGSGAFSTSGLVSASTVGDLTSIANFLCGSVANYGSNANSPQISYLAVGTGVGAATGLAANLAPATSRFINTILR